MDDFIIVDVDGNRYRKHCRMDEAMRDFAIFPRGAFLEDSCGNLLEGNYRDWMRKYHPRIGTPR